MTPSVSIASMQGTKIDAFEQLVSVMVRMVLNPPEGGNLVMKSIAIVSKGSVFSTGVMGKSGGQLGFVFTLVIWHVVQPLIYSVMKVFMLGHQ